MKAECCTLCTSCYDVERYSTIAKNAGTCHICGAERVKNLQELIDSLYSKIEIEANKRKNIKNF